MCARRTKLFFGGHIESEYKEKSFAFAIFLPKSVFGSASIVAQFWCLYNLAIQRERTD